MLPIVKQTQGVVAIEPPVRLTVEELDQRLRLLSLRQVELAMMVGKNPSTVSAWVNGKPQPPPYVHTIVRLVQALREAGVLIECRRYG
jgi:transcriptional regulator with XRE-family HTH domain